MTTVEIWFKGDLEPEVVEGDLVSLMNSLNIAAANGKLFAIFDSPNGDVLVQTRNINKARERADEDAYVGR